MTAVLLIPSLLQSLVTLYHLKWHNSVRLVQVSVHGTFGVGHYEFVTGMKFRQLSFTRISTNQCVSCTTS